MIRKKFVHGIVLGILILTMTCVENVQTVEASMEMPLESTSNLLYCNPNGQFNTLASDLVWVIKNENGKRYRRLYDTSSGKWLTDWIPCD